MAHMIEDNMFAYKGEAAWHGLGFQVDPLATGEDMLKVAGMDWQVNRRRLAMRGFGTDGKLDTTNMLTSQLEDYRAIVRADTNHVFQIASAGYSVVQNIEIVNFFREYCEAGHASIETVGGLRGGAVVWALAKLEKNGGDPDSIVGGDDALKGYLLLATSHDGSLKTIGKPTQTRVVCHNTMQIALGDGKQQFSMKHTRKFGDADKADARRVMNMATEQVSEMNEVASQLAKVSIDHDGWMAFIGALMGDTNLLDKDTNLAKVPQAIADATMSSPGSNLASARGTLWGAVNGVTYYVDHVARARSESNRLFSAWFGSGESMKNTAMRVAMDMAGVTL